MEKTTIYIPTAVKLELKVLAKRTQRTEAEIVRAAIAKYVAEQEQPRPRPRSWGMYEDGSVDAAEYETYLEKHRKPDW